MYGLLPNSRHEATTMVRKDRYIDSSFGSSGNFLEEPLEICDLKHADDDDQEGTSKRYHLKKGGY